MSTQGHVLLQVTDLKKYFMLQNRAVIRAVDNVSFALMRGETLSIVGESGCGKSTLGRTAILIHKPSAGRIVFDGQDLRALGPRQLRARRKAMQLIFQDPYASLDTRRPVGKTIIEPLVIHGIGNKQSRQEKLFQLLETVGLDKDAAGRFPHEFSGGQRQRIGIARAIAVEPKLIVADEPVSALDVSIQSQILNLLVQLKKRLSLSYIFISHDLAVVKHISDRVCVMYLGRIVETAATEDLFNNPLHPYTVALISAIPRVDRKKRARRIILEGDVPDPAAPPPGCSFHPRCAKAEPACLEKSVVMQNLGSPDQPHLVACHLYS